MSDEADRAEVDMEQSLERALAYRKPEGPSACGYCHFCGDPCSDKFCSVECRDDWDKLHR